VRVFEEIRKSWLVFEAARITQNPVGVTPREGSIPSSGTNVDGPQGQAAPRCRRTVFTLHETEAADLLPDDSTDSAGRTSHIVHT